MANALIFSTMLLDL